MLQLDQIKHEAMNLASIIIGNCELGISAAAAPLDPSYHIARFQNSISACQRLVAILRTDDSSDVSKVDYNQPININAIATEVARLLKSTLVQTDKVRLSLDLASIMPIVEGNQWWMGQSIINLCLNARDAMIEHGGELKITTHAAPGVVFISVCDTGHGMTEKRLRTIWTPRLSPDRKHGHGLQVVKLTVERMRGKIDVTSKIDVGTTFTISLPAMAG